MSKTVGCCGRQKEETFSVLCIGTSAQSLLEGIANGMDSVVSRLSLDDCTLLIREQESIDKFTKKQILAANGVVFLVNSAVTKADIENRAVTLRRMHEHPGLFGTPCLLFATHQDQNSAFSCDQLETLLDLSTVRASRSLLIHCCSGEGSNALLPGFTQLANELLKQRRAARAGSKMSKASHSFTELTSKALDNLKRRSAKGRMHSARSADDTRRSNRLPTDAPCLSSSKVDALTRTEDGKKRKQSAIENYLAPRHCLTCAENALALFTASRSKPATLLHKMTQTPSAFRCGQAPGAGGIHVILLVDATQTRDKSHNGDCCAPLRWSGTEPTFGT